MAKIKIPRTGEGYFAYERLVALRHLLPWLKSLNIQVNQGGALDVGCGYGGTVAAVREVFGPVRAIGLDVDAEMVALGKVCLATDGELRVENFLQFSESNFDLLLMRDVLEHMPKVEAAMIQAYSLLKPGGSVYVSFAPFYSPFGGHQHNGSGFASHLPWIQVLPERIFRRVLKITGNWYKAETALQLDMDSVLATRLTVSRFLNASKQVGVELTDLKGYLSRPEYTVKFGLPKLALPALPIIREWFCTGVEAVLHKPKLKS